MEGTLSGPAITRNQMETYDENGRRPLGFVTSISANGAGTSTGRTRMALSTTDANEQLAKDLDIVFDSLKDVLLQKNAAYGDSLMNPIRVFSKAPTDEQINVRIDDKLSRIANWERTSDTEDPAWDLLGYLVMREVYYLRKSNE